MGSYVTDNSSIFCASSTSQWFRNNVCLVLNEMRFLKELTDFTLITEDGELPVHWSILTASSMNIKYPLLDINSKKTQPPHISYPQLKFRSVSILMDYIYTGYLHLPENMDEIRFLLKAAKYFQVGSFNKHVESELATRITSDNYVTMWELAEQFSASELEHHLEVFVAFSIEELWRCASQFGLLKAPWLLRVCIIGSASPSVSAESLVQAVLCWLRTRSTIKDEDLNPFLPYLHLADCKQQFLKDLWKNEQLVQILRPLKRELYNAIISQRQGADCFSFRNLRVHTPQEYNHYLQSLTTLREHNFSQLFPDDKYYLKKQFSSMAKKESNLSCHQSPCFALENISHRKNKTVQSKHLIKNRELGTSVYDLKCQDQIPRNKILDNPSVIQKSNLKSLWHTWHVKDKMPSTALLVILGRKKNGDIAMRCFNPEQNVWLPTTYVVPSVSPITDGHKKKWLYHGARLLEGAASAYHGAVLYLAGGIIDPHKDRRPCSAVLAYDVTVSVLKELPSMPSARAVAGAAVLNGYLYVVGGTGQKGKPMNLVERYDVKRKKWVSVQPLPQPCWEMGVAACCGRLFACGGRCRAEWTQACYSYNPETNQWFRIDALPSREFDNTYPVVTAYNNCLYAIRHQNPKICARICRLRLPESKWTLLQTTSSNIGLKKVVALLPWNEKLWIVDMVGKLSCYDLSCQRWCSTVSFVKCLPYPLYAAILVRDDN